MISWIPLLFSLPISNVSASPTGLPLKYIFNLSPYPLPTMLPLRTSFNRTGAEAPPGVPAYTLSHLWNIFCRASRMAFENIVRSCHSPALNSPVVSVRFTLNGKSDGGPRRPTRSGLTFSTSSPSPLPAVYIYHYRELFNTLVYCLTYLHSPIPIPTPT